MATLEEVLRDKGANDQMVNSKTFKLAQEAIAEGAVDGLDDARLVEQSVRDAIQSAQQLLNHMQSLYSDSYRLFGLMHGAHDQFEADAAKVTVTNKKTIEAINAYETVLARTRQTVGEDGMTEAIWIKAIEAGSYCAWRSIMGPKFPEGQDESSNRGGYKRVI